mmetsp:Transcript_1587/g.1723  ORF Transcript_1587/g.1723 Transcript_1587/m.1723 type:complete len:84 (-) Transcript_1587:88-339(-)
MYISRKKLPAEWCGLRDEILSEKVYTYLYKYLYRNVYIYVFIHVHMYVHSYLKMYVCIYVCKKLPAEWCGLRDEILSEKVYIY